MDPWDGKNTHLFSASFGLPGSGTAPPNDCRALKSIAAIRPVELNARVVVQASRFTLHGRNDPLEEHPLADKVLYWVKIRKADRREFLEYLWRREIRRSTLFPDLDNLSEDLARFGPTVDL
jgi:hypothetical protein